MTTNNFSTNSNEDISMNDQLYASQIYREFFDNDYIHCKKKIVLGSSKSEVEIKCYNTWKEYKYFLWINIETLHAAPRHWILSKILRTFRTFT